MRPPTLENHYEQVFAGTPSGSSAGVALEGRNGELKGVARAHSVFSTGALGNQLQQMHDLTNDAMRDTEGDGKAGSAYQVNVYGTNPTQQIATTNSIHRNPKTCVTLGWRPLLFQIYLTQPRPSCKISTGYDAAIGAVDYFKNMHQSHAKHPFMNPPLTSPITNFPFPLPAVYFFSPLLVVPHATDTPSHSLHLVRLGNGTHDADKEGEEDEEEVTNCCFTNTLPRTPLLTYMFLRYIDPFAHIPVT
jgi:hypothetical protein